MGPGDRGKTLTQPVYTRLACREGTRVLVRCDRCAAGSKARHPLTPGNAQGNACGSCAWPGSGMKVRQEVTATRSVKDQSSRTERVCALAPEAGPVIHGEHLESSRP